MSTSSCPESLRQTPTYTRDIFMRPGWTALLNNHVWTDSERFFLVLFTYYRICLVVFVHRTRSIQLLLSPVVSSQLTETEHPRNDPLNTCFREYPTHPFRSVCGSTLPNRSRPPRAIPRLQEPA